MLGAPPFAWCPTVRLVPHLRLVPHRSPGAPPSLPRFGLLFFSPAVPCSLSLSPVPSCLSPVPCSLFPVPSSLSPLHCPLFTVPSSLSPASSPQRFPARGGAWLHRMQWPLRTWGQPQDPCKHCHPERG